MILEKSIALSAKLGLENSQTNYGYLIPDSAEMSFFDENVSHNIKRKIVLNLKNDEFVGDIVTILLQLWMFC